MKKSGATCKLLYTRRAYRDISRLDPSIRKLVKNAIEKIRLNPYYGKPLKHSQKGYRSFRTTDYRIIYEISSRKVVITVVEAGLRKDVYKRLIKLLPK